MQMTKIEEQKLLNRLNNLEKEVARLNSVVENNKIDKHIYSVKEAADILGLTRQAVYVMVDRGELETVKLGRLKILGSSLKEKLGAEK